MPILLLGSSVFQLRRYADTATLPQSQDRTPRVRFRPPGTLRRVSLGGYRFGCCPGPGEGVAAGSASHWRVGPAAVASPAWPPTPGRPPSGARLSPSTKPCPNRCHIPLASGILSWPISPSSDVHSSPEKKNATPAASFQLSSNFPQKSA